jgi:hypothetical protein
VLSHLSAQNQGAKMGHPFSCLPTRTQNRLSYVRQNNALIESAEYAEILALTRSDKMS